MARATGWLVGKLVRAQEEIDRATEEVIGANLKLRSASKDEGDFEGSDLEKALRASHERLIAESQRLDDLIRETAALIPAGERRGR